MENNQQTEQIQSDCPYTKFPSDVVEADAEIKTTKKRNIRADEPTDPTEGSDFSDIDDEIEQRYFDEEANDEFVEPLADPNPATKKKPMMTPHPNKGVLQRDKLVKNSLLEKLTSKPDSCNEIIEEEEQPRRATKTPHPSKGVLNRGAKAEHGAPLERVLNKAKNPSQQAGGDVEAAKDSLISKGKHFLSNMMHSESSDHAKTESSQPPLKNEPANTGMLSKIKEEFINLASAFYTRKPDMSSLSEITMNLPHKEASTEANSELKDKAYEKVKKSARFAEDTKHVKFAHGEQIKQYNAEEPIVDSSLRGLDDDHGLVTRLE